MPKVRRAFMQQVALLTPQKRRVLYVYLLSLLIYDKVLLAAQALGRFPTNLLTAVLPAATGLLFGHEWVEKLYWAAMGGLLWVVVCLGIEIIPDIICWIRDGKRVQDK